MVTKEEAMTCSMFYNIHWSNKDGTAVRCRANGKCKTWKTRPDDFRLPVKYGLKQCFYITPQNASEWLTYDPTQHPIHSVVKKIETVLVLDHPVGDVVLRWNDWLVRRLIDSANQGNFDNVHMLPDALLEAGFTNDLLLTQLREVTTVS